RRSCPRPSAKVYPIAGCRPRIGSVRLSSFPRRCPVPKRVPLVLAVLSLAHALSAADAANGLTAVEGLKVGHFTLKERPTGCTVVLAEKGAVAGVDVRGGAPGTRETNLLDPVNMVEQVHAIVLSGG